MKFKYINIHAGSPYDRGPKVDVFAYGQMLFELFARERFHGVEFSVTGQVHGQLVEGQDFHQKFTDDPSYNIQDGAILFQIADECCKRIEERPEIKIVVKNFKNLKVEKWLNR